MRNELGQRPLERALTEQDEFGKTFLLYRSHPSLCESIQIWAAWRKAETPNALGRELIVERRLVEKRRDLRGVIEEGATVGRPALGPMGRLGQRVRLCQERRVSDPGRCQGLVIRGFVV